MTNAPKWSDRVKKDYSGNQKPKCKFFNYLLIACLGFYIYLNSTTLLLLLFFCRRLVVVLLALSLVIPQIYVIQL